jgi:hypothetical protein
MDEDEREWTVAALMCLDRPTTATIVVVPLVPRDEPPDTERLAYLSALAFQQGPPRYRSN